MSSVVSFLMRLLYPSTQFDQVGNVKTTKTIAVTVHSRTRVNLGTLCFAQSDPGSHLSVGGFRYARKNDPPRNATVTAVKSGRSGSYFTSAAKLVNPRNAAAIG